MSETAQVDTSGSETQTTQEGAKTDVEVVGKKKVVEKGSGPKEHFQYPIKRSGHEDSLLIRCVKYEPPKKSGPLIQKGRRTQAKEDFKLPENSVDFIGADGTVYKPGSTIPKGKDFFNSENVYTFRQENYSALAQGTDKRYNQHQKDYSGNTFHKKTQFYVELPIPKQIGDSKSVDWGENSLNMFQMAAFNFASDPANAGNDAKNVLKSLAEGNLDTSESGLESATDITNAMRAALSGMAVNVLGGNVTPNQFMSRATGKILNSNKELLFNGVKLREFAFDFTFTPRSREESKVALKIIRKLKQHMSPRAGEEMAATGDEGLFVNSPDLFLLRYLSGGKDHPFLNSFKPCALTSLNVNYSAGGVYSSYGSGGDSTPVHMKVNMIFKETNPVYFEDYNDGIKGVGF
tara:strand:+ start:4914 stop:6128 length:1215 start_codon:yes stop_codon:yes gene_type:complete